MQAIYHAVLNARISGTLSTEGGVRVLSEALRLNGAPGGKAAKILARLDDTPPDYAGPDDTALSGFPVGSGQLAFAACVNGGGLHGPEVIHVLTRNATVLKIELSEAELETLRFGPESSIPELRTLRLER